MLLMLNVVSSFKVYVGLNFAFHYTPIDDSMTEILI